MSFQRYQVVALWRGPASPTFFLLKSVAIPLKSKLGLPCRFLLLARDLLEGQTLFRLRIYEVWAFLVKTILFVLKTNLFAGKK